MTDNDQPTKFLTVSIGEAVDGVGVEFSMMSFEDGAVTMVFTVEEAEDAWKAIQRCAVVAAMINSERELGIDNSDDLE